jgi:hypothetical protein
VVDFEDVARGREISAHISTLDDRRKADFYKIVRLLSEYLVADEVEQKIAGGYSNQPRHYNNTPMLVYSRLGKGGRALNNGWYARVPLVNTDVAPMTVFLNESSLRPDYDPKFVSRQRNVFVPKDLKHFINHPELYLIQL